MFLRFGRSGYTRIMRYALDHAIYLRDRLIRSGKFQIMNHTQRIPVVALTIDNVKELIARAVHERRSAKAETIH